MIDTLARHLAALSEARRLIGLVLANNPDFVAWQRSADPAIEASLAGDRTFVAYRHLEAAINLLRPEPFVKGADPTTAAPDLTAGDIAPVAPTATTAGISAKVVLLQPRLASTVRVVGRAAYPAVEPVDPVVSGDGVSGAAVLASPVDAPPVATRAVVSAAIVADAIVYGPHLQGEAAVSIVCPSPGVAGPGAAGSRNPQVGDLIDRSALWPSNGSQQPATEPPRRRRWLTAWFGRRLEKSA